MVVQPRAPEKSAMNTAAVLFDVNETLFALDPLERLFEGASSPPGSALELWLARLLRDGFALAACDAFEEFSRIGAWHLYQLVPAIGDLSRAEAQLKQAMGQLRPHDDVEPAFARLREAGIVVATLTNGNRSLTSALLERASLSQYVQTCFDVSQAGAWKPTNKPYRMATDALGVTASATVLVAAHPWDIWGAKRAGLRAAFVDRKNVEAPAFAPRPDLQERTLDVLAEQITAGA